MRDGGWPGWERSNGPKVFSPEWHLTGQVNTAEEAVKGAVRTLILNRCPFLFQVGGGFMCVEFTGKIRLRDKQGAVSLWSLLKAVHLNRVPKAVRTDKEGRRGDRSQQGRSLGTEQRKCLQNFPATPHRENAWPESTPKKTERQIQDVDHRPGL